MSTVSPKKILRNLGFDIARVEPAARTRAAAMRPTHGWIVELVGPSGVGKTTLRDQIVPRLHQDWFFERHAKGLLGDAVEDATVARYIKSLLWGRLDGLQSADLPLETIAAISQRVCEVVRLGLAAKSSGMPRGFIMDDSIAHFFAEQILAQDRTATQHFMDHTAYIFLLPDEAVTHKIGTTQDWTQLDVYCALRDLILDIGRPTLLLRRSDRENNPEKVIAFLKQDVLGG